MESTGAGAGAVLVPFREFVVKVHSRCDLACDHCYIYEHADQSWRQRPAVIPAAVVERFAERLAEHARAHALASVTVILLGGEPLLAGPARLRRLCEALTRALDGVAGLDLRIHTNGLRLNESVLALFAEYGVGVGVSLDGDRAANDRHRRYANGRSSHSRVLAAIGLLGEDRHRPLYQGLLCTIDVRNDPAAVLDALLALAPPRIDFLLPHATWEAPPPRPDGSPDAYARWLLRLFDHWDGLGRPVPVRLFDSLLSTLRGGPSLTESLGLTPTDLVVVETDGTLEQADSLKTAHEGAAATGFDVFRHAFDEVAAHPGIQARQLGLAGVSAECRACPVVRSCGGGLYAHRYRAGNGFDNPSVYCADLKALVEGVEQRTARASVAAEATEPAALAAAQQELTRVLLVRLNAELEGRGDVDWRRSWELVTAVEAEAPDALDAVLDHPYTRTWLLAALDAVRQGGPPRVPPGHRLSALAAAAVVRGGLELPALVAHGGGGLYLPTLGLLRADRGRAEVRAAAEGFSVRGEGGGVRTFGPGGEAADWQPVRVLAAGGAGAGAPPASLALEDLDPDRGCFALPPAPRLDATGAGRWERRLAEAWELLHGTVPAPARETAAGLTTLTPLAGAAVGAGATGEDARRGPGALGVPLGAGVRETALALLTGRRRARLRELTEVADLYASDGEWLHPSPWQEEPVPVSRLLADVHAAVAAEAFRRAGGGPGGEPGGPGGIERALDRLDGAAELTVSGKAVVAALRREFASEI
ncbi:radical SAM/SPASM protein FxsBH, inactivated beta-hydroxylase extension form [Streptomyces sp. NPDC059761]|uniref:radical SAM/SPASM protein FxsBH, inactivated beta-hydroxylase extension form n=1 Tax=Streptomyces sp. NPDC059761 TaxID=3346937 RepID=UPI00364E55C5